MLFLTGKYWRDGKFWVIECPSLGASTQGFSKEEAFMMMVDWIQTTLDDKDFPVLLEDKENGCFEIGFYPTDKLYQILLSNTCP
jgi:predicted RNase H-like HicB family nuclease